MSSCTADEEPKALHTEIQALMESIRDERKKYNERHIIKRAALDCLKEDCELEADLKIKVNHILMTADIQQCLELPSGCALLNFEPNEMDLTFDEKQTFKEVVQRGVLAKCECVARELVELGIAIDEENRPIEAHCSLGLSTQENVLLDFKRQLLEKQNLYSTLLQEYADLLEQIVNLKLKTLVEAANDKINVCEVQHKLLYLRREITSINLKVKIFTETTNCMDAYRMIWKDIKQQQEECVREIEKLQELKEKYRQVSCKQYDDILKSYLQYKSNIHKKKLLCNQLRNK